MMGTWATRSAPLPRPGSEGFRRAARAEAPRRVLGVPEPPRMSPESTPERSAAVWGTSGSGSRPLTARATTATKPRSAPLRDRDGQQQPFDGPAQQFPAGHDGLLLSQRGRIPHDWHHHRQQLSRYQSPNENLGALRSGSGNAWIGSRRPTATTTTATRSHWARSGRKLSRTPVSAY